MLFHNKVALIVDDSFTIRHQIKILLRKFDITVLEAFDKQSMIKYFSVNNKPIDLFLMDLSLRDTTGFELMDYIRESDSHKDTPIIVLTGDAKKDTVIKSTKYDISFYAIKPIDATDFTNKVFMALENANKSKISNSYDLEQALNQAMDEQSAFDSIDSSLKAKPE